MLEGVDKSNNLLGTVMYPHQGEAAELGLHLVQAGLAKVRPCGLQSTCFSGRVSARVPRGTLHYSQAGCGVVQQDLVH